MGFGCGVRWRGPLRALGIFTLSCAVIISLPMPQAQAAVGDVSLVATPNPVEPGDEVNLIAGMPAGDEGTLTQTLYQYIDPSKMKLTGVGDIIAPEGWLISVSTDGSNFTTPALPSAASWSTVNWSAVNVVKATGSILSGGSDNGLQVATGIGEGTTTSNLPGQLSSSTGDGYDPFFNAEHTMVFNIPHHASYGAATVDCHVLADGSQCTGFPYPLQVSAGNQSTGRVIGTGPNTKLWTVGVRPDTPGSNHTVGDLAFECIDLALVVAGTGGPRKCMDGSVDRSLITVADQMTWSWTNPADNFTWDFRHGYSLWTGFEGAGNEGSATNTKLWTVNTILGTLVCVDTALLAPCTGMPNDGWPIGFSTIADPQWDDNATAMWGDFIYIKAHTTGAPFASTANYRTTCLLASNPSRNCPGWTDDPATSSVDEELRIVQIGRFVQLPSADGGTLGVCLLNRSTTVTCFDALGNEFSGPTNLVVNPPDGPDIVGQPIRQGTRIYYGNGAGGSWVNYFAISCWDAAANNGAGGGCMGTAANPRLTWSSNSWTVPAGQENYAQYSLVPDPVFKDCLWLGQDLASRTLRTINARTGLPGCNTLSQVVEFDGAPIVPRMGCSTDASGAAIRYWRAFTLTQPSSGFSAATLTVKDEDGQIIEGWADIPIKANTRLSLRDLPVSVTGQEPIFSVNLADVTIIGTVNAEARVEAVGDAPELCVTPIAQIVCPALSGQVVDQDLPEGSTTVTAEGSSTLASSTVYSNPASLSVSITAPTVADCGVQITGTATEVSGGTGSPRPVGEAVVSLLALDGTVLATTTTATDGTYSFGYVAPGSYQVKFADTADALTYSATIASVASTGSSTPVLAGATDAYVTSSVITVALGTPGIVNALYELPIGASPDTTFGPIGIAQTINPLSNDSPTSRGSWQEIKLCDAGEASPNCTLTSLAVVGVGTYTVTGTGSTSTITFVPESDFRGEAPPITYQATDQNNASASSTYTPTVYGPVTGVDDAATSAWDSNILFTPLSNDLKDATDSFVASSLKLCGVSPTETAPNCTKTQVDITGEGTYKVNSDGSVTFDPLPSFSGTVSQPVTYIVQDKVGQVATAQITPTILDPQPPSASPDTAPVLPTSMGGTGTTTFNPILAPGQGALAYGAGTPTACLIDPATGDCDTNNSVTIPGEGTYVLNPSTNIVTFTLDASFTTDLPITPVRYRVTDFVGNTAESTLTPDIPSAPLATPDVSAGYQDVNQVISVLLNDSAGNPTELDPSTVRLCGSSDTAPACTSLTLIVAGQGTYTVDPTSGAVTFDPLPNFVGTATQVTYSVKDQVGQQVASTITPKVLAFTDSRDAAVPTASTDRKSGPYAQPITLTPRLNDRAGSTPENYAPIAGTSVTYTDPILDPSSVRLCGPSQVLPDCTTTSVTTVDGTYVVDAETGEVTFTPATGFSGTVTQPVSYQISNMYDKIITTVERGLTEIPETCLAPDCATVAVKDANNVLPGQAGYIPTWDITTVSTVPQAFAATALLIPTINPPSGPLAKNDSATTPYETPIVLSPVSNDVEGGFPLRASSLLLCGADETAPSCTRTTVTIPNQGTFSVNTATGEVTFVPVAGFVGVANVPYRILDWNGAVSQAVISVIVTGPETATTSLTTNPVQEAPAKATIQPVRANNDVDATSVGNSISGSVALNDEIPGAANFRLVSGPQNGSVTLAADGTYTYSPSTGFVGLDTFTYRVCTVDTNLCSDATVTITVVGKSVLFARPTVKPIEAGTDTPVTFPPVVRTKVVALWIAKQGTGSWAKKIVVPNKGVWSVKGTKVRFKPYKGFKGQTSIRYRVIDSAGAIANSVFTARATAVPEWIHAGR